MELLLTSSVAALAFVFCLAAGSKVRSRAALRDFEQGLSHFGLPQKRWLALAVVALELAAAIALWAAPVAGFVACAGLLIGFSAGLARALRRGVKASCGCFGASKAPISAAHLVRNALLLGVCALGLFAALSQACESSPLPVRLAAVAGGLFLGGLFAKWDELVFLVRAPVMR